MGVKHAKTYVAGCASETMQVGERTRTSSMPAAGEDETLVGCGHNDAMTQALATRGYCRLPQVLSARECRDAVDLMEEFLRDTTAPCRWHPQHRDTSSAVGGGSSSSAAGGVGATTEPNITFASSPSCCYQRTNGAGWLLNDVRELLAERVFERVLGTRELHSSKEGFVFYQQGEPSDREEETTLRSLFLDSENHDDDASTPVLRSLVALEA